MRCVVNVRWLNTLIIGVWVLVGFSGRCLRAWGWWRLCRFACIASGRLRPLSLPVFDSVSMGLVVFGVSLLAGVAFSGHAPALCRASLQWLGFRYARQALRFCGFSSGFASRGSVYSVRSALVLLGAVGLGAIGSVLMPFSNRQVKFLFFRPSRRAPDACFLSLFR